MHLKMGTAGLTFSISLDNTYFSVVTVTCKNITYLKYNQALTLKTGGLDMQNIIKRNSSAESTTEKKVSKKKCIVCILCFHCIDWSNIADI